MGTAGAGSPAPTEAIRSTKRRPRLCSMPSTNTVALRHSCTSGIAIRPDMTPTELKSARHALGLSAEGFARLMQVGSGRTVRRWEAGDRDIPGPVVVLTTLLLDCAPARKRLGIG